jgi:hypothetical protein
VTPDGRETWPIADSLLTGAILELTAREMAELPLGPAALRTFLGGDINLRRATGDRDLERDREREIERL